MITPVDCFPRYQWPDSIMYGNDGTCGYLLQCFLNGMEPGFASGGLPVWNAKTQLFAEIFPIRHVIFSQPDNNVNAAVIAVKKIDRMHQKGLPAQMQELLWKSGAHPDSLSPGNDNYSFLHFTLLFSYIIGRILIKYASIRYNNKICHHAKKFIIHKKPETQ
jgi:hypothetical protein